MRGADAWTGEARARDRRAAAHLKERKEMVRQMRQAAAAREWSWKKKDIWPAASCRPASARRLLHGMGFRVSGLGFRV